MVSCFDISVRPDCGLSVWLLLFLRDSLQIGDWFAIEVLFETILRYDLPLECCVELEREECAVIDLKLA